MSRQTFNALRASLPEDQKALNALCLRWSDAVIHDRSFSGEAVLKAAWHIQNHMNFRKGFAWPSFDDMARKLGMSERHFQRAVCELEKRDFIVVQRKNGCSNYYVINPQKASQPAQTGAQAATITSSQSFDVELQSSAARTCASSKPETRDTDVVQPTTPMSSISRHTRRTNTPSTVPGTFARGAPRRDRDEDVAPPRTLDQRIDDYSEELEK